MRHELRAADSARRARVRFSARARATPRVTTSCFCSCFCSCLCFCPCFSIFLHAPATTASLLALRWLISLPLQTRLAASYRLDSLLAARCHRGRVAQAPLRASHKQTLGRLHVSHTRSSHILGAWTDRARREATNKLDHHVGTSELGSTGFAGNGVLRDLSCYSGSGLCRLFFEAERR